MKTLKEIYDALHERDTGLAHDFFGLILMKYPEEAEEVRTGVRRDRMQQFGTPGEEH